MHACAEKTATNSLLITTYHAYIAFQFLFGLMILIKEYEEGYSIYVSDYHFVENWQKC